MLELWVPTNNLPEDIKSGDVIRVKSVVAANNASYQHVMIPTDHSNFLLVDPTFKQHAKLHKRGEEGSYSLAQAILGGQVGSAT